MLEAMKVWREAYRAMRNAGVPGLDEDDRACAAASVISDALQKAREEERAAVVAWLRGQAEAGDRALLNALEGSQLRRDLAAGVVAINGSAGAIQGGEHRREG